MTDRGPIVRSSRPSGGGHEVGEVGLAHDIPVSGPSFPRRTLKSLAPIHVVQRRRGGADEMVAGSLHCTLRAAARLQWCWQQQQAVAGAKHLRRTIEGLRFNGLSCYGDLPAKSCSEPVALE